MGLLDTRIVLVTGGATPLGAGLTRLLVAQGAHVLVADGCARVAEGVRLADDLAPHARFELLETSSERDWLATLSDGIGRYGGLDVLVLVEPDAEAVALALRTAGPHLARRGGTVVGVAHRDQARTLGLAGVPVVEVTAAEPTPSHVADLAGAALRYVQYGLRASRPAAHLS